MKEIKNKTIYTPDNVKKVKELLGYKVTISGFCGGWNVWPTEWNFT